MHSAKGVHPSCRGASAIHGFAAEAGEFTRRAGELRQLTGLRLKRRRPRILLGSFGSSSGCKCNAGVHWFFPERFGKSRRCRGTLGSTHVARGRSRPAGLRPKHGGLHILPGGIGQLTVLQLRGYCRTSIWCRPFARRAVDWPHHTSKTQTAQRQSIIRFESIATASALENAIADAVGAEIFASRPPMRARAPS